MILSGNGAFYTESADGTVTVLSEFGPYYVAQSEKGNFGFQRILSGEEPEFDGSVCKIMFPAIVEKNKNEEIKQEIKIVYNIDENEWW